MNNKFEIGQLGYLCIQEKLDELNNILTSHNYQYIIVAINEERPLECRGIINIDTQNLTSALTELLEKIDSPSSATSAFIAAVMLALEKKPSLLADFRKFLSMDTRKMVDVFDYLTNN